MEENKIWWFIYKYPCEICNKKKYGLKKPNIAPWEAFICFMHSQKEGEKYIINKQIAYFDSRYEINKDLKK